MIHAEVKLSDNDAEVCLFDIWDRPWIKVDGRQVTVKCGNDKKYKLRRRRSLSSLNGRFRVDSDVNIDDLFHKFKLKYHRNYGTALEHNLRMKIFKKNIDLIKQLNTHEQGTAKYGVTAFTDMTPEEFRQRTGLIPRKEHSNEIKNQIAEIPDMSALPKHFDWREKGVITEVFFNFFI